MNELEKGKIVKEISKEAFDIVVKILDARQLGENFQPIAMSTFIVMSVNAIHNYAIHTKQTEEEVAVKFMLSLFNFMGIQIVKMDDISKKDMH
jgi:hypothetical protein